MARATVLKRFELSPEAAGTLEAYAKETGQSQTAVIEAACFLLARIERPGSDSRTPASPDVQRIHCLRCSGLGIIGVPGERCEACNGKGWSSLDVQTDSTRFPPPVVNAGLDDSLSPTREERKQSRSKRRTGTYKAHDIELAESVGDAVKGKPVPSHTFHSGAKPIAGCETCSALARGESVGR